MSKGKTADTINYLASSHEPAGCVAVPQPSQQSGAVSTARTTVYLSRQSIPGFFWYGLFKKEANSLIIMLTTLCCRLIRMPYATEPTVSASWRQTSQSHFLFETENLVGNVLEPFIRATDWHSEHARRTLYPGWHHPPTQHTTIYSSIDTLQCVWLDPLPTTTMKMMPVQKWQDARMLHLYKLNCYVLKGFVGGSTYINCFKYLHILIAYNTWKSSNYVFLLCITSEACRYLLKVHFKNTWLLLILLGLKINSKADNESFTILWVFFHHPFNILVVEAF